MTIKNWLRTYTQGHMILQGCVYLLIFFVTVNFIINHPDTLAEWQFLGTVLALVVLLILNIVWAIPDPDASRKAKTAQLWAFFILSIGLILQDARKLGSTRRCSPTG